VLSFGKRGKKEEVNEDGSVTPREPRPSVAGALVRKLSFGKKRSTN